MAGSTSELRVVTGRETFDVERVRQDFPILAREVNNKPLVYLDSASSAQKPLAVIEAMDYAMRAEYANVHRGIHYLSNTATQKYEDARETCRRFLNARSAERDRVYKECDGSHQFGRVFVGRGQYRGR